MPRLNERSDTISSAEQLYRANRELIQSAVDFVARNMHLSEPDREDFVSAAHLKLIQDDYAVFRKFQGGSTLRTYVVAVIKRFGIDFRNQKWGRWRPSVAAKRLGDAGIALETLLYRDGHPFPEAVSILAARGVASEEELETIGARLPVRLPRRFEPEDALQEQPDVELTPLQRLREAERVRLFERIADATREVSAELDPHDQLILRMGFEDGLRVADIARVLGLDQKQLYRRRQGILAALRQGLEQRGFHQEHVAELFHD